MEEDQADICEDPTSPVGVISVTLLKSVISCRPRYRESYCVSWGFQDFIFILSEDSGLTSLFVFARDESGNVCRVVSHPFPILDATVVDRMTDS